MGLILGLMVLIPVGIFLLVVAILFILFLTVLYSEKAYGTMIFLILFVMFLIGYFGLLIRSGNI